MTCPACGEPRRPDARFCTVCGAEFGPESTTPVPVGPRASRVALAAVLVALTCGVAFGTVVLVDGGLPWSRPVSPSSSGASTVPSSGATGTGEPQAGGPSPASGGSASDALEAQADADRPAVESVLGYWVPQISSKASGAVASGVTYDDALILRDVQQAKSRYPAALLRSSDFSSFRRGGFWVTVVLRPFGSAAEANAWCDANGFAAEDCLAKRLSHTEGPDGNAVPR